MSELKITVAKEHNREIDKDRINIVLKKLDDTIRHCDDVKENCELLGRRMLERGYDENLCISLIKNGRIHDASKFSGIEFDYLSYSDNKEGTKLAIEQHRKTNSHHVGYWSSINDLPDLYLAELVCDVTSRSQEFGENIFDYIKTDFLKKYNLTTSSRVYKKIKEFLDILLDKPFGKLE